MCLMSAPHLFCGKPPPSLGHCEGPKPSFSLPVNLGRGHCLKASVGRPWGGGVRPSKDWEEAWCAADTVLWEPDLESGLTLRAGSHLEVKKGFFFFLFINVMQALMDFRKAEKKGKSCIAPLENLEYLEKPCKSPGAPSASLLPCFQFYSLSP